MTEKNAAQVLEEKLVKLTLVVSPSARAPGLVVKRDGRVLGESEWGLSVPVDPGEHVRRIAPCRPVSSAV